ncbi:MAG: EAL domain-containing protein [Acidimicrobiia bacterium]
MSAGSVAGVMVVLGLVGVLVLSLRCARLARRCASLEHQHAVNRLLAGSPELESAVGATLGRAEQRLRAGRAEVELHSPHGDSRHVVVTRDEHDRLETAIGEPRPASDAVLSAPLLIDGVPVGRLTVVDPVGIGWGNDAEDTLRALADQAAASLHAARLVDRLRTNAEDRSFRSLHDVLTGTGNRNLFVARAEGALRDASVGGWRVAVMLLDLSRFTEVNETVGYGNGNLLLQQVAERIRVLLPPHAMVARLGGDEFAVLLPQVRAVDDVERVAVDLDVTLHEPFVFDDVEVELGGAIGIALYPDHGAGVPALLERADLALFAAKEGTDGAIRVYAPEQGGRRTGRLALAAELRHAIEHDRLDVHYQPQGRLDSGGITGVEALLRWRHPVHGVVPPDEFVPLAEHTGLMGSLTEYVLERAVHQARRWRDAGLDLTVAVNLSPPSLIDLELPLRVERLLHQSGLEPERLVVEVSETELTVDPLRTLRVLDGIAALGVGVTIEDFGRGLVSLAFLRRAPGATIKIDRSFVQGAVADDAAIDALRTVVELGHRLGRHVMAEGVEDQITWDVLAVLGCDLAQGYLLARPLPADRLESWLHAHATPGAVRTLLHAATAPVGDLGEVGDAAGERVS